LSQKASGSSPPHKHCRVCGISIAPNKDYCSSECKELDESTQTRMKNYRRLTLILMVAAMAALVALTVYLRLR
jgi:predicted nucleic acid-binding Zn ribbon protein